MNNEQSSDESRIARGRSVTHRFTMVPQWAMLHSELSDPGFRLYCLLLARVNKDRGDNKVWPGQQSLAKMLDVHRNTIGRLLTKELEPLGFVSIEEERYGDNNTRRRNVYYVHEVPPDDWQGVSSIEDWDKSKTAGQPGRTMGGATGGTTDSASGRTMGRASGRTTHGAENKMNLKQEELRTTHAAGAAGVSPEVVDSLCRKLADRVAANGVKRPEITRQWREAAVRLLSPDNTGHAYTVEEIEGGIEWAQSHNWWPSRTNTMTKFAKHFATMMIQAQGNLKDPSTEAGKAVSDDLMKRRLKALDKAEADMEKIVGRRLTSKELKALQERIQEEVQ